MPEPGHVARQDDGAVRTELPARCLRSVEQRDYDVVGVVREAREHRAHVERAVLAPLVLAVRDVLPGYHSRHRAPPAFDVRSVEGAYLDRAVQVALGVVRVVEVARGRERVAGHEQALWVEAPDGVHFVDAHGVRLGHDDEQVRRVEALQVVGRVGGEPEGEALVVELVARPAVHPARQLARSAGVGVLDLPPDDVVDLPRRGAGHERLHRGAGVHPPQHDARRGPVLAGAVAADDRHAPAAGHRLQDRFLLIVGLLAEHLADEPHRVLDRVRVGGHGRRPARRSIVSRLNSSAHTLSHPPAAREPPAARSGRLWPAAKIKGAAPFGTVPNAARS